MKRLLVVLLFVTSMFAQTGRTVVLTWTDPNVGLTNQTYSIYKATGACTGTPVFSKIASGLTPKTYSDVGVAPGVYCYTATVTANGVESAQSIPLVTNVGPLPVTGLTVTIQ